ncbi:endothelin-converting enzyme homolog isoform X2 [Limulus polyphemus]|nr:endothelin-converting enzyme homolog isoform X2 [Limulus polyphemus]XP_022241236.1 endothelin-converting enzyme homolog isoform X2 [Limulus polyphemus]
MPHYKRTEFEEDETSNTNNFSADAPTAGGVGFGSSRGEIVGGMPDVRYPHRKRNFWQRASPLEKLLMVISLTLALAVIILSAILGAQSQSLPLKVVHITSENQKLPLKNDNKSGAMTSQGLQFRTIRDVIISARSIIEKGSVPYCVTPACVTVASAIINAMDHTVDPCDDFYQYSCGGWIKSNPLPDGKSIWGTFGKLWQENQLVIKNVLEDETIQLESEAERKARTYYYSCLDKNGTLEELGAKPLMDFIKKIGGWNITGDFDVDQWNFQNTLTMIHNTYNYEGLFSWIVGQNQKNSSYNILQVDQGGLNLPSRDYYLNKTQDDEVLGAYLNYMTTVGSLLGGDENDVRRQMSDVIEFETKLANITIPTDQRLDEEKIYHKMTIGQLQKLAPVIDWVLYFNHGFNQIGRNIKSSENIVVYSPEFLQDMSTIVTQYLSTPEGKTILNNYLGWSVVKNLVSFLSKPFRESPEGLRKALIGSEGVQAPWRYCVGDTNEVIGFALGAMFVRDVFNGDSKAKAENMINEIKKSFKDNMPLLDWMDAETRHLAKKKADAIIEMIGFPDFILSPDKLDEKYKGVTFMENEYFENNIRSRKFFLIRNMKRLDQPVNNTEWEMTPLEVDAYYTATKNRIVFPAGILQSPFYDTEYPKSLNFGAIGVVMGHELTHAFDDQGRKYDKNGNLKQWWKNKTIEEFLERTKCFIDQYSSYSINDDHVNGKQTLGENIADNGGIKAAFHAYEEWSNSHEMESPLPGVNLTHRQLFFVGFSQVWCSVSTPESQHLQILNDLHSPAKYRVIGSLSNSYEFAQEFQCPIGSYMNPSKKCEVW